jgi:hypothetical protein
MDALAKRIFSDGIGDGRVRAIAWRDEHLLLDLDLPEGSVVSVVRFRFEWVMRLRIELDYGEYGGYPLIFQAVAKPLKHNRWQVLFEFGVAPDGRIEFECNDITAVAEPNT